MGVFDCEWGRLIGRYGRLQSGWKWHFFPVEHGLSSCSFPTLLANFPMHKIIVDAPTLIQTAV
jgi:hypothetical protein